MCSIVQVVIAFPEQLAHPAVDLHLKEISVFLHGSEMNKPPLAHSVLTVYKQFNQLRPHPSELV